MDGIIIRRFFTLLCSPLMKRKKSMEVIDLSDAELEGIKSRLASGFLLEDDKSALLAIVTTYVWLQRQLHSAKLTIYRLKKMFGFSTEKRNKKSEKRKTTELALDLNTLDNLDKQEDSLSALQSTPCEPPTKK